MTRGLQAASTPTVGSTVTASPDGIVVPLVGPAELAAATRGVGVSAHLQPIVDLARGLVVGHECLARFEGGAGPLVWLHAARRAGVAAELEAAALRVALAHRATPPANTFLSVNLSPELLHHGLVQEVLADQGSLAGVVVELTEDTRIESYGALTGPLHELREAGATIAIDDAGAGYAGLAHLLHLRPDFLKLDRALVAGLDQDEAKRAMVEMVGTLAGRLDAWIVAEGVETEAELGVLVDLGVPLAQGYWLGRPAPGFTTIDATVGSIIGDRVGVRSAGALRALVQTPVTASHCAEAEAVVSQTTGPVVVIDRSGRPLGTVRPDLSWWPVHGGALAMSVDTSVAEAAARAITRDRAVRFDPILGTDAAGRLVGAVSVERLVDVLARA